MIGFVYVPGVVNKFISEIDNNISLHDLQVRLKFGVDLSKGLDWLLVPDDLKLFVKTFRDRTGVNLLFKNIVYNSRNECVSYRFKSVQDFDEAASFLTTYFWEGINDFLRVNKGTAKYFLRGILERDRRERFPELFDYLENEVCFDAKLLVSKHEFF